MNEWWSNSNKSISHCIYLLHHLECSAPRSCQPGSHLSIRWQLNGPLLREAYAEPPGSLSHYPALSLSLHTIGLHNFSPLTNSREIVWFCTNKQWEGVSLSFSCFAPWHPQDHAWDSGHDSEYDSGWARDSWREEAMGNGLPFAHRWGPGCHFFFLINNNKAMLCITSSIM